MNSASLIRRLTLTLIALMVAPVLSYAQSTDESKLVSLANASRAQAGLPALSWDPALATAARAHAALMAKEGPISHRYGGEDDLPQRAAKAGARFSRIEENIAVGPSPDQIHDGWMHSQAHHDNLLSSQINRIGVALVEARGVLFAVADYTQGVTAMSARDVEAKVGGVVQARAGKQAGGLTLTDPAQARAYCAQEGNSAAGLGGNARPKFLMRWQSAEITKLPPQLEQALASGNHTQAAIGACEPQGSNGGLQGFSGYRVAVLLY